MVLALSRKISIFKNKIARNTLITTVVLLCILYGIKNHVEAEIGTFKYEKSEEAQTIYDKLEKPATNWLRHYKILDFHETAVKIAENKFDYSKSPETYVFAKKHKCASTSYSKSIAAYGRWRGVDREEPLFYSLGGCYPKKFDPVCRSKPSRPEQQTITFHAVFNSEYVSANMPKAKLFTSVRHPQSHFYSTYNFFYWKWNSLTEADQIECQNECWGQPYRNIVDERTKVEPGEYLDLLESKYDADAPWSFRTRNFQAFEMGIDDRTTDKQEIFDAIQKLVKEFDLILITERYYESMILLAAHLNVPVENIYSPSKKQADYYPKPKLSSNQDRVFRKFFNTDLLIYDIANIIMDEKIEAFGRKKMDAEIARFKSYLENCKKHMRQCDALTFHGKHSDKPHTIEEQVAAGYDFTPVDRKYFLQQMENNRGYCGVGLQKAVRESEAFPDCAVTNSKRIFNEKSFGPLAHV